MKGFSRRLAFYGIGLLLGVGFTAVFVRGKYGGELPEFCYLPNCRVLKELRSKPVVWESDTDPAVVPSVDVQNHILRKGRVRFRQSTPRAEPCGEYRIEDKGWSIEARNCSDTVYLKVHGHP